jgi:hypothetical protein
MIPFRSPCGVVPCRMPLILSSLSDRIGQPSDPRNQIQDTSSARLYRNSSQPVALEYSAWAARKIAQNSSGTCPKRAGHFPCNSSPGRTNFMAAPSASSVRSGPVARRACYSCLPSAPGPAFSGCSTRFNAFNSTAPPNGLDRRASSGTSRSAGKSDWD